MTIPSEEAESPSATADDPLTSDDAATAGEKPTGRQLVVRILLLLVAAVVAVVVARTLDVGIPDFLRWVEDLGVWGPVIFILGYAVATVAFIPGSVLTLAGGAIFGVGWGSLYVFAGASLGATAAFLIARYLARRAIEVKIAGYPRFAAIDRAVGEEGRKIVLLLRLSPVFPFTFLNYGLGLTRVRLVDYLIGFLGMVPATILYTYFGLIGREAALAVGGTAPEQTTAIEDILLGLGLLATLAVTIVVTRIARRALKRVTDD